MNPGNGSPSSSRAGEDVSRYPGSGNVIIPGVESPSNSLAVEDAGRTPGNVGVSHEIQGAESGYADANANGGLAEDHG